MAGLRPKRRDAVRSAEPRVRSSLALAAVPAVGAPARNRSRALENELSAKVLRPSTGQDRLSPASCPSPAAGGPKSSVGRSQSAHSLRHYCAVEARADGSLHHWPALKVATHLWPVFKWRWVAASGWPPRKVAPVPHRLFGEPCVQLKLGNEPGSYVATRLGGWPSANAWRSLC